MKRTTGRILSFLLALAMLASLIPAALAEGPVLSVGKSTLRIGETTTASVAGAEGVAVFSSSNKAVASINETTGVITALTTGTTVISAKIDDETVGAPVTVTVVEAVSSVTTNAPDGAVAIDADAYSPASPVSFTATVAGAITGDTLTVTSSDETVAAAAASALTVSNQTGTATVTITPKKLGTATITVACGGKSASVAVTVTASESHKLRFAHSSMTVAKGQKKTNTATSATSTDVITYSSQNSYQASVNATTGEVTGVAAGSRITITATAKANGVEVSTASYVVTVADLYTIALDAPTSISAGDAAYVTASVYQYNAMNETMQQYTGKVTLNWKAYTADVAAFAGETSTQPVTSETSSGTSRKELRTYSAGSSADGTSVTLTVTATIDGQTYTAPETSVKIVPATASSFSVSDEEQFDEDDFTSAVNAVTGENANRLDAITISGTSGGSVYSGSSRVGTSTKYYVTGSSNRISSLYFKANSSVSSTPYFTYVGYDANGKVIATGRVTVGGVSVDVEYSTTFGGSVTFIEDDFAKAFKGQGKTNETLDYVQFYLKNATVRMNNRTYNLNDSGNASIFGWAYATKNGTTKLSSTDKCYYQATYSQLDLDAVTYQAGTYTTKYTVYIPYTATGTSGSTYNGFMAVNVSGDDTLTAVGASMKSIQLAEQILMAYPDGAYVTFKSPLASEGQLLYNFSSIVNENYTKIDFASDKFYLSTTSGSKNKTVDNVYFLPAADCASQIKFPVSVYSSSDRLLGTTDVVLRVATKTASAVFSDVTARTCSWAADAVDFMNYYGLVKGTSTSTFNYGGNMTRGDFVLILYRNAGSPSVYGVSNPFTDVKSTDYYYEAVLWAYRNGVVNGTGSTTFSPKGNITREQIASILWRLAKEPSYSVSLRSYTDYTSISAYAQSAMSWAVGYGYVKGSGAKLNPKNNATRAEVAVMLHRFLTK